MNGKKYVINGNVHANSDIAAYLDKLDVRGKLETTGKVINYNNGVTQYIKKENAPERVLIDPSAYIVDSLGANATIHEYWQTYSNSTIENTTPIQAKSGLQFCGSEVKLKDTIVANNDMMVSASQAFVSQNNEEVLMYSVNGNISIYAYDMEINGIIYAPKGTVQICGTNIKINGMIIANKIQISADNKLLINQNLHLKNSVAFNYYNDELQIFADAEYDDTTKSINVNWESTYDEGKVDIYTSTDDNNYTLLDTVTGVNTYDKTGVLCFSSEVDTYHDLTSNSTILKNVTERIICEEGDPAYDVGIRKAVDKLKVLPQEEYINGVRHVKKRNIVFISDGEGSISQSTLNYAKANNVIINTVVLSRSSDYGSNNLFKIADATNGKRFYVLTTNIFINEYNHYGTHSNLDVTTNTDSDQGDTLPDIFEENGMMCTNGEILFSDKTKGDTDGDGLKDSDEVKMVISPEYYLPSDVPPYVHQDIPYRYVFVKNSDPMKVDTDGDGYGDEEDVLPLSIYNTGEYLEATKKVVKEIQIALQFLGYLDMGDYGYETYGGLTKAALNIYRLNHSIILKDDIDTFTYAVLLNDYYLKYFSSIARESYLNSNGILYKPFTTNIYECRKPVLSQKEINNGVSVKLVSNNAIRDKSMNSLSINIWLYDFTVPINDRLNKEEKKFLDHREDLLWFFNQVKSGGPWDIKVKTEWKNKFSDCAYISDSFSFIYQDDIITPSKLGNITYGYLGLACRFNIVTLLNGGDFAAFFSNLKDDDKTNDFKLDSMEDKIYIFYGYNMYKNKYPDAEIDAIISNMIFTII